MPRLAVNGRKIRDRLSSLKNNLRQQLSNTLSRKILDRLNFLKNNLWQLLSNVRLRTIPFKSTSFKNNVLLPNYFAYNHKFRTLELAIGYS
jgi:hypothetical protein